MARLVINPTSASRREITLQHSALSIGRDPANDLVLPDAMVSRRHAVLECRGDQFYLKDCNSSNGSLVNGDRIAECPLKDGDLIAIGATRILFRAEMDAEADASRPIVANGFRRPCPQCRSEASAEDQYCRLCGAQLAVAPVAKMLCPMCSSIVMLPARFCHVCGTELRHENDRLATTRPRPVLEPAPSAEPPSFSSEKTTKPERSAASPAAAEGLAARSPYMSPAAAPQRDPISIPAAPRSRSVLSDSHVSTRTARSYESAGAWRRLAAAVIDEFVVSLGMLLLLSPAIYYWWPREVTEISYLPILLSLILLVVSLLLGALYHIYFWGIHGATFGKQICGLLIQSQDGVVPIGVGRATLRLLGYAVSAASLGIGFLLIAFTGNGLHDLIAGTRVVRQDLP
jgi:uncharacterized RDD family membrane protein YckC